MSLVVEKHEGCRVDHYHKIVITSMIINIDQVVALGDLLLRNIFENHLLGLFGGFVGGANHGFCLAVGNTYICL